MSKKGMIAGKKKTTVQPKVLVSPAVQSSDSTQQAKASDLPQASPSARQAKIQLLWLHFLSPLYRLVPISVLREIGSYTEDPPLLILVSGASLSIFDIAKGKKAGTVKLRSHRYCHYPSYAIIDNTKVLCCGGMGNFHLDSRTNNGEALSEVFTVEIATGQVDPLPSMQMAREQCGLIIYSKAAYVFGGRRRAGIRPSDCSVTCESLQLSAGTDWERLGDMNAPRISLNPCLWQSEIYLCDGASAEIFSPVSRLYRGVSLGYSSVAGASVYMQGRDLIVLSLSSRMRLKYQDGELVIGRREHNYFRPRSHCPPVVWGNRVYLYFRRKMVVVNAETGEMVEEQEMP